MADVMRVGVLGAGGLGKAARCPRILRHAILCSEEGRS